MELYQTCSHSEAAPSKLASGASSPQAERAQDILLGSASAPLSDLLTRPQACFYPAVQSTPFAALGIVGSNVNAPGALSIHTTIEGCMGPPELLRSFCTLSLLSSWCLYRESASGSPWYLNKGHRWAHCRLLPASRTWMGQHWRPVLLLGEDTFHKTTSLFFNAELSVYVSAWLSIHPSVSKL